jgi:hypothetical protein
MALFLTCLFNGITGHGVDAARDPSAANVGPTVFAPADFSRIDCALSVPEGQVVFGSPRMDPDFHRCDFLGQFAELKKGLGNRRSLMLLHRYAGPRRWEAQDRP